MDNLPQKYNFFLIFIVISKEKISIDIHIILSDKNSVKHLEQSKRDRNQNLTRQRYKMCSYCEISGECYQFLRFNFYLCPVIDIYRPFVQAQKADEGMTG